jgi:hypothetical protein
MSAPHEVVTVASTRIELAYERMGDPAPPLLLVMASRRSTGPRSCARRCGARPPRSRREIARRAAGFNVIEMRNIGDNNQHISISTVELPASLDMVLDAP